MSVARGKATDFSCVTTKNITMKGANFLEKLLDNQPVEWKKLGEVFITRNGYTPSKSNPEYWEGGTIPWYRMEDIRENGRILSDALQHITPKGVKGNGLFKANSIILATSATIGEHALITTEALANQRFTNFEVKEDFKDKLFPKFIFYYFYIIDDWCKKNIYVGNFPSVDVLQLKKLDFPIPPLSVQSRIVEILDKFTAMEAELEEQLQAELELRKKQYAYYREQLLNFSYTPPSEFNVVYKKLGEVCELVTDFTAAGSFASNAKNVKYLNNPDFALLVRTTDLKQKFQNEDRFIYVDKKAYEYLWRVKLDVESIIMPNVGNCGEVYFVSPEQLPYSHCVLGPNALLIRSNIANQKFLFYLFHSADFQAKLSKITSSTGQTKFNKTNLKQLPIPLPPLSEQERIVEILDKFDTLTNSISEGLPLEIQLRRQQYEYYREQLLDFRR